VALAGRRPPRDGRHGAGVAGPVVGVDPLPRPQGASRGARARARAPSGRRRNEAPPADDGGVYDKDAAEPPSSNSRAPQPQRSTTPPRSPTAPPIPPDALSLIASPAGGGSDNDVVRRWSARLDAAGAAGSPPDGWAHTARAYALLRQALAADTAAVDAAQGGGGGSSKHARRSLARSAVLLRLGGGTCGRQWRRPNADGMRVWRRHLRRQRRRAASRMCTAGRRGRRLRQRRRKRRRCRQRWARQRRARGGSSLARSRRVCWGWISATARSRRCQRRCYERTSPPTWRWRRLGRTATQGRKLRAP